MSIAGRILLHHHLFGRSWLLPLCAIALALLHRSQAGCHGILESCRLSCRMSNLPRGLSCVVFRALLVSCVRRRWHRCSHLLSCMHFCYFFCYCVRHFSFRVSPFVLCFVSFSSRIACASLPSRRMADLVTLILCPDMSWNRSSSFFNAGIDVSMLLM